MLKDGSRIVNFASIGYKRFLKEDLDTEKLECTDPKEFNQMQEYCRAKLCCILHSVKLSEKFDEIGSPSLALACHPGAARTSLMYGDGVPLYLQLVFRFGVAPLMALFRMSHSLYDGALPAVEALIADDAKPGMVYAPGNRNELAGEPKAWEIDKTRYKDADIERLWRKSQEMLGLSVDDYL